MPTVLTRSVLQGVAAPYTQAHLQDFIESCFLRKSEVADGAGAVAHEIDTSVAYVTAGAKLLSVRNNGVEKAYVDKDGNTSVRDLMASNLVTTVALTATGNASVQGYLNASYLYLNGFNSVLKAPANGVVTLLDNAETSFGRLQFGGTTSSYPSLKRSSATLHARLADDSAYANVTVGDLTLGTGQVNFEDGNGFIRRTAASNSMAFAPSAATASMVLTGAALQVGPDGTANYALSLLSAATGGAQGTFTIKGTDRGGNGGVGHNVVLRGGAGSTAGAGSIGGHLTMSAGDAKGTGNNNGGSVFIYSGLKTGSGVDGDLYLGHDGTNPVGGVRLGTHTAIGAEAVTGYITIRDWAGNTRKIAVVS